MFQVFATFPTPTSAKMHIGRTSEYEAAGMGCCQRPLCSKLGPLTPWLEALYTVTAGTVPDLRHQPPGLDCCKTKISIGIKYGYIKYILKMLL
jgi:hypothetical protein